MPNTHNTQAGQVDVAGASLHYEIAGKGSWLVLLHAGVADKTMWDAQVAAFAEHYRVLRYDMCGFGRSTLPSGSFSHRQDLHNLLETLGVERAHFVGCSLGGATVLDFTLEHPESVASLVLVASAVNGYQFKGKPPQTVLDLVAALEKRDLDTATDLAVRIWVDGPERTPDQVDAEVRERVRAMSRIALRNQLPGAAQGEGLEPPAIHRLVDITAPTFVVLGDKDDSSILDIGDTLTRSIAGADKLTIRGAAHLPSMEKPEAFNRAVLEFLRQV